MAAITIRRVEPNEVSTLQYISIKTFTDTFAASNDERNMQKYVEQSLNVGKLSAELAQPGSEFYFALDGEVVIGYLKVNTGTAQTEPQGDDALEIERIYVLQTYLGQKVGQLLYHKALDIANARNASFIWLGVWEENHRAVAFYRKNGFEPFGQHTFVLGEDHQTDILMRLSLQG